MLGFSHTGNTHNGEYDTLHGVVTTSNSVDSGPSVVNMTVGDNTMFAFVASPIVLNGTRAGTVTGNSITAYNCFNITPFSGTNSTFKAGVYVGGASDNVSVSDNSIGGGGNSADPAAASYCYQGVIIDSASGRFNYNGGNTLSLADGSGNPRRGKTSDGVRIIAAGGALTPQDQVALVANASGASTSVSLPPYPVQGQRLVVKDAGGNAGTYLIQVIPGSGVSTIDGAANQNITTNYGSRDFIFNGTEWNAA